MKNKLSCGSALLLVFIVSFVVSLAAIRCWHVSSLMCDVQSQRELFYKRFYLTNRILNTGIDLACKNFDIFLKLKKTTDVDVNFCLTEVEIKNANVARFTVFTPKTKSEAKLRSGYKTDFLILSASLMNSNQIVCNLKCLLERNVNDNSNAETKEQNATGGTSFMVTHFTLSASL